MLKWLTQYANGKVGYKARKQKYDVTGRADPSPEKALWIGGVEAELPDERSHVGPRKQTVRFDGRLDEVSAKSRHFNSRRHLPDKPPNARHSHNRDDSRQQHGPASMPHRDDFREYYRLPGSTTTPIRDYATIPGHDRMRGRGGKTSHRAPVSSIPDKPRGTDPSRVSQSAGSESSHVPPAAGDTAGHPRLWPGRHRHLVVEYTSDDSPDRQGADPRPRRLSPSAESRVVASAGGIADDEFFIICPPSVAKSERQQHGEQHHRDVAPAEAGTPGREAAPDEEAVLGRQAPTGTESATSDGYETSDGARVWSSTLLEKIRRRQVVRMGRVWDTPSQPPGELPAPTTTTELRELPTDLSDCRLSRLDRYRARVGASPPPEQRGVVRDDDAGSDVAGPVTPVDDGEPKSVILEDSGVTRISVTPARSRSEESGAAAAPERPVRYISTSLPRPRAADRPARPCWVLTLPIRSRTSPPPAESRSASDGRKSESACRDTRPEGHDRDMGDYVNSAGGVTHVSDKIHVRFVNRVTREAIRSRSWSVGRPGESSSTDVKSTYNNDVRSSHDAEVRSGREAVQRLGRNPGVRSGQSVGAGLPSAKIGSHVITNGSLPRMTRQSRSSESAREPPRTIAQSRPSVVPAPAQSPDSVGHASEPCQSGAPQRSASFRLTEPDQPAAKRVTVVPRRSHSEPRGLLGPETSVDDDDEDAPSSASYAHIATLPRTTRRRPRQAAAATQTSPRGSPEPRDTKATHNSKESREFEDVYCLKEPCDLHETCSSRERRTASERRPAGESVESVESGELTVDLPRPRSASVDSAQLGRICQQALSSLQHVTLRSDSYIATTPPAPLTTQVSPLWPSAG